jgi:hypothetical protein
MLREGLTRELRSGPSELSTAFLKESIKAVTCGSLQIVEGAGGATTVVPGAGVTAPGVSDNGDVVCVGKNKVGVAERVGVACAAEEAHPARRINPIKNIERVLVFIVISSFDYYNARLLLKRDC